MKFINEKTATVIKFVAGTAAALLMAHAVAIQCSTCIEFVSTIAKMACDKIESL